MSKETRRELASRVKDLREAAGMKQEQLADLANLPRTTISNMENGMTPQQATLERVLDVLGVEHDVPNFEAQTELWLTTMGTLIESIPTQQRPTAVDASIRVLAEHVRSSVGGSTDTLDLYDPNFQPRIDVRELGLAAETGEKHTEEP